MDVLDISYVRLDVNGNPLEPSQQQSVDVVTSRDPRQSFWLNVLTSSLVLSSQSCMSTKYSLPLTHGWTH